MADPARRGDFDLEQATLLRSVRCRRCGYDLRSLLLAGPCPECGQPVWDSVRAVIDPAASRLPSLTNPRGVGTALVAVMACLLGGTLLLLARPLAGTIALSGLPVGRGAIAWTPAWLPFAGGIVFFVALGPVLWLRPPARAAGREHVRHDVGVLAGGVLTLSVVTAIESRLLATYGPELALAILLRGIFFTSAVITLIALRRVLLVIGEHSREFRTARGGRQRIRELIVAVVAMAVADGLRLAAGEIGRGRGWADGLWMVGTVLLWICTFMLVVGLAYLLVNAWWIRRSLRSPLPTLAELAGIDLPAGILTDPAEDLESR